MPLIIEGNKIGVKSEIYWIKTGKYDSPHLYLNNLNKLSKIYEFEVKKINWVNPVSSDIVFFLEGSGLGSVHSGRKICLNSMRDFTAHYDSYVGGVEKIFMCSEFFAEHYHKVSHKNRYLGTPKYDITIDPENIKKKYSIKSDKNLLLMFPQERYLNESKIQKIKEFYKLCNNEGFNIIVKSRGKNPVNNNLRGNQYFEDVSWFPHSTMELITISDLVINFDSTTVKECIMMNKPFINFRVKEIKRFEFMYDGKYCKDFTLSHSNMESAINSIKVLSGSDFSREFEKARAKYLFEKGAVAKNILEDVL